MDKSKAAADAVKLINQAKEDSNLQPLMIKAVCSFFDIMKGKELSQADRLFLHYLANQAGLPQYYYPMLNVGEYVDEEVTLQTFSNYINEAVDSWRRCHVASLPERTLGKIQERAEKSYFSECFNIFRKNILDIRDCKEDGIY